MLTSASPPRNVFNTIQILRGLAALLVVLFHLTLSYERHGQELIAVGLFRNGFAGVDLFFVISGFVIMHTSHYYFNKPAYFSTYIRKRLIRIYPIYWITLILIVSGLQLVEFVTQKPLNHLPTAWYLIISTILLLPDHPNVNGVTWSLSFELYYYLLFGLLIVARPFWLLIAGILTLSAMAVLDPILWADRDPLLTYFFSPYNLEFASGVLAWWIIDRYKLSSLLCFLLLAISGVWLLTHERTLFEEVHKRVLLYGISSFLVVLAFTGLERNGWFKPSFVNRLLMKIGDASYLIYLVHFPILFFYGRFLTPLLQSTVSQNIASALFTVGLTVVCIDLHNRFEAPLVKKLNQYIKPFSPNPNNG